MISFALAIPHTPWVPARVESICRLHITLGVSAAKAGLDAPPPMRVFEDKEPNWSWSDKLWDWGHAGDHNATHLVQLQDDVIVAPNFWAALQAMVEANPDHILNLQGAHPAFRAIARHECRWAQSRAWMVGVAYVIPRFDLIELCAWRRGVPDNRLQKINEDDLIAEFCMATGRAIHHPIPTIIDHDTSIESTYNNEGHSFRRPTVSWKEYGAKEIEDPLFWKLPPAVPVIANPHGEICWFCYEEPGIAASAKTQAWIGRRCLAGCVSAVISPQPKVST